MKFCLYLIRDLNFEPDALQPCCNTRGLSRLPRFPFTGGPVDMQAYRASMQEAAAAMQDGGSMCAGCDQFITLDLPRGQEWKPDILFRTVSLNMHRYLCNCRCIYCDLWKTPARSYEVLPALKSLKKQNVLYSNCFFSWGGGEPCILPEFEKTSAWIMQNNYYQYVHSNALRFSPSLANLLARGRCRMNVSLDSATPATYQVVKGQNGFARVTENLRRYVADAMSPDQIDLKYIVFEKNNEKEEILRFFHLCQDLGVSSVQLSLNFQEVNSRSLSETTLESAAFFLHQADKKNMHCSSFFISTRLQEQINGIRRSLFGEFGHSAEASP